MTIKVGDTIPDVTLHVMGADGPEAVTTAELFGDKVIAVFGVPGAFTPTCSNRHLPGYIERAAEIRAKGADGIVCVAVNDAFVMGAWARDQDCGEAVTLVADGSGVFAQAAGLELDLTELGLGVRCQRFAMIVDNGVVKDVEVEDDPTVAEKTGAEKLLERMADAYLNRGSAKTGL